MAAEADVADAHEAMLAGLRAAARPVRGGREENDSYGGSGRPFLNVAVPERRRMVRAWLAAHRGAPAEAVVALADSLFNGVHHEEKTLGALLLGASAVARQAVTPTRVEDWLGRLNGWAEVDCLCAGVFGAAELVAAWPRWRTTIIRLSRDPNINRRRAALVLLTTPCRTSPDPRFRDLAFETIDRLKLERPILITKAVSWLLRNLAAQHPHAVAAYLEANRDSLPAIALRETRVKLATGTKSGRSRRGA